MKKTIAIVAVLSVWYALADAYDDLLISFSTVGPDRYADGTTVKDGEWYALCWTTNATFGGMTVAGLPAMAGDRVLLAAPLAVQGHCPYTVFQLGAKEIPTGGRYVVCLLDTRDANALPTKARSGASMRVPTMLNGSIATATYAVSGNAASCTGSSLAVSGAWSETTVDKSDAEFSQARIACIEVSDDHVRLTVSCMMPGVRYNVLAGEQVTNLTTFALDVPITKDAQENVPFLLKKSAAHFFRVTREPLAR